MDDACPRVTDYRSLITDYGSRITGFCGEIGASGVFGRVVIT